MTSRTLRSRRSGLLIPLFSIPSTRSWGIGEIGDLEAICAWLARAGQRVLLMLPINEMPAMESSPYSALSAMAIDPQFITLDTVEDFVDVGGELALEPEWRARLNAVRSAAAVDYPTVRALKSTALHRAFEHFQHMEWKRESPRAARFAAYSDAQSWWLDDYALFRALHAHHGERPWTEWPQPIRERWPEAISQVRAVDCRRAMGRSARARQGRGLVWRPAVCRQCRQC
jgi:4-alpha-glucanotransferase